MKCSIENCDRHVVCKGMCGMHYKRMWTHGDPNKVLRIKELPIVECSVADCNNRADRSSGMCAKHHRRMETYGRLHTIRAPAMGVSLNNQGYISIVVDGKSKLEHIYKAELALGRPLPKGAVVHHMNRIKWDNDTPFNLVICPSQDYHLLLHRRAKELGYEDN